MISAAGRLLIVAALGLVVLSVLTSDTGTAVALAGLATAMAVGSLLAALGSRLHRDGFVPPVYEADSLVLLRSAFGQGRYGRETVLAHLSGLEATLAGRPPMESPEEREALLQAPDDVFLDVIERRVAELEVRS